MAKATASKATAHSHTHHHPQDVSRALAIVTAKAEAAGERMTEMRREVVSALCSLDEAESAYRLLASINKKRRKPLSAMSLYRTLDFLIRLGVAVKIDSRNVYMLCASESEDHSHLMIICDNCGTTRDIDDHDAASRLQAIARKHGHQLKHHVVELHGTCADCTA